jgi:hypothetical protein
MRYYINEFAIDSDLPLPVDTNVAPAVPPTHTLTVRRQSLKDVPSLLRKVRRQLIYDVGDGFLIEPHLDIALHIDFHGKTVLVDCPDDENRILVAAAWLLHAGLGASTLTHGGLPLHGAGLTVDGKYIALMADSGAGKSTLSSYLLENGAQFGSDDLVPVHPTPGQNETIAYPSVSQYPKIAREVAEAQGLNLADLLRADYGTGDDEYYLPIPTETRILDPLPLSAIFALTPKRAQRTCQNPECDGDCGCGGNCACGAGEATLTYETGDVNDITVRRLEGDEAAQFLAQNLHASWLLGKYMNTRKLLERCSIVASQVPIIELSYTRSYELLPKLHEVIHASLKP